MPSDLGDAQVLFGEEVLDSFVDNIGHELAYLNPSLFLHLVKTLLRGTEYTGHFTPVCPVLLDLLVGADVGVVGV